MGWQESQRLLHQTYLLLTADMFPFHIRQLHALLPRFLGSHFAPKELHHNIHSFDIVPYIGSKVGTNSESGTDTVATVFFNFDGLLHVQTVRKDQVFEFGVHTQLLIPFNHLIRENKRVAAK